MQFEGDSADPIAKAHIGDPFHLSSDFFEEEVVVLPGHLRQCISVSIDLLGNDDILSIFVSCAVIMVILRLHLSIKLYQHSLYPNDSK